MSVRTIERAVADIRRARRAAALAAVRVESAPGDELQIDFCQSVKEIASEWIRVFLLVAVPSYSRRLFVKAFFKERQDDRREGIATTSRILEACRRTMLGDNARALVLRRDRTTGSVFFTRRISGSVATATCSGARAP